MSEKDLISPLLWETQHSNNSWSNNAFESFYSHYNSLFYKSTPHIHQVITNILEIQNESNMKLNSINRSKRNTGSSETVQKYKFLQDAYTIPI